MAGNTTNVTIRMDADLKAQAEELFAELGMNLTTAFNVFVRQSLRQGGLPFEIKLERPNKETIAAMLEAPYSWQMEVYKEKDTCALSGGLASVILFLCHSISSYTQK